MKEARFKFTVNGKVWEEVDGGKVFSANQDKDTEVRINFKEVVRARAIRIYPHSWNQEIALRF